MLYDYRRRPQSTASEIDNQATFNKNTILLDGDSIASQNSDTDLYFARGCFIWGNVFLNGYFKLLENFGAGGDKTADMLSRLSTTLASEARYAHYIIGKNDVEQSIADTTIIANLTSIIEQTLKSGKIVIMSTIIPGENDTTAISKSISYVNNWIRLQKRDYKNYLVVDYYKAVMDASTGLAKADYTVDAIHPSAVGAFDMGKVFSETLQNLIEPFDMLPRSNVNDDTNLVVNPLFVDSTGGLADGFGKFNDDCTPTIDSSGEYNKQVLTTSAITNTTFFYQNINTGFSVGDTINSAIEYEITDATDIDNFTMFIEFKNVGGDSLGQVNGLQLGSGEAIRYKNEVSNGVIAIPPAIVPADTTRIVLWVGAKMQGVIKLGRCSVSNI